MPGSAAINNNPEIIDRLLIASTPFRPPKKLYTPLDTARKSGLKIEENRFPSMKYRNHLQASGGGGS